MKEIVELIKDDNSSKSKNPSFSGGSQNFYSDNNFYIFGDVGKDFCKEIVVPFIEVVEQELSKKEPEDINIYITSPGGYVSYAFDLITHMEKAISAGINVNTYVTSYAASAGSLIAVSGSHRYISKRAYHLLHYMRGFDYSHNPIMSERNNENAQFWQDQLIDIYASKTKMKRKTLEKKLLADNYMINGSDECIKVGLADEEI